MKKVVYAIVFTAGIFWSSHGMDLSSISIENFDSAQRFCENAIMSLQTESLQTTSVTEAVETQIGRVASMGGDSNFKIALLEKMDAELRESFPFVTEVIHGKVKQLSENQNIYNEPTKLGGLLWLGIFNSQKREITDTDLVLRVLKLFSGRNNSFLNSTVYPAMRSSGLGLYIPRHTQ